MPVLPGSRAGIATGLRSPPVSASPVANAHDVPANAAPGVQLDELGIELQTFDAFNLTFPDRLDLTTHTLGANFRYEIADGPECAPDRVTGNRDPIESEAFIRSHTAKRTPA